MNGDGELSRLKAVISCNDLISLFAWHVDRRDYDGVISLFSPDCVVERPGARFEGHEGLRAMLDARPTNIQTLHCFSNIHIAPQSGSDANGLYCFALYSAEGEFDLAGQPLVQGPPTMTGQISDTFKLTDQGWRIATRSVRIVFAKS